MREIKHGIKWSKDLETGNPQVDSQHHRLFELVSDIIEACIDNTCELRLRETLEFLVEYTVQHFIDEEALQLQVKYPDYENHKKLHDDFTETVSGLVRQYLESGSSEELSSNVNKIVVHWLVDHIQYEDKKIGLYIHNMHN